MGGLPLWQCKIIQQIKWFFLPESSFKRTLSEPVSLDVCEAVLMLEYKTHKNQIINDIIDSVSNFGFSVGWK